jgi:PleD family two-component response regulator
MPESAAKPRVLVADDERVIADTLVMILNQSGFDARAVYSGEKAHSNWPGISSRTCSSPT